MMQRLTHCAMLVNKSDVMLPSMQHYKSAASRVLLQHLTSVHTGSVVCSPFPLPPFSLLHYTAYTAESRLFHELVHGLQSDQPARCTLPHSCLLAHSHASLQLHSRDHVATTLHAHCMLTANKIQQPA
jgi:hypothetical protein